LIERASNDSPSSSGPPQRTSRRDDDDSDEIERLKYAKYPKKKKMSSLLGEIFEF
jgi:Zn-finger nucleic acid-binding protein